MRADRFPPDRECEEAQAKRTSQPEWLLICACRSHLGSGQLRHLVVGPFVRILTECSRSTERLFTKCVNIAEESGRTTERQRGPNRQNPCTYVINGGSSGDKIKRLNIPRILPSEVSPLSSLQRYDWNSIQEGANAVLGLRFNVTYCLTGHPQTPGRPKHRFPVRGRWLAATKRTFDG